MGKKTHIYSQLHHCQIYPILVFENTYLTVIEIPELDNIVILSNHKSVGIPRMQFVAPPFVVTLTLMSLTPMQQFSGYLGSQTLCGHYFLISPRIALVLLGWLYFGSFLQLNFQFVPQNKEKMITLTPSILEAWCSPFTSLQCYIHAQAPTCGCPLSSLCRTSQDPLPQVVCWVTLIRGVAYNFI